MFYTYYEDDEGRSLYIFDIMTRNVTKRRKSGSIQRGMMCHCYVEYNTFSKDENYDTKKFIPHGAEVYKSMIEVDSVEVKRRLIDILFRKFK